MSVLEKSVLVLNRAWLPCGLVNLKHAILQVACGAATALDIDEAGITPKTWDEWINLPIRADDDCIRTQNRPIRAPTVIACVSYAKLQPKTPKFGLRGVEWRDQGQCQYTGKKLRPEEKSLDHVVPRCLGGADDWSNVVLCDKSVNARKGGRTPSDAGLQLIRKPSAPRMLLPAQIIKPTHPHHRLFLKT